VNILECAETLAAFLAILALVIAREFKLEIKALDFLAQKLSATKHGVDFGSWLSILSEFRGLQFSDEAMGVFVIRELLSSLKEDGFDLFSQLSSRRNDQSHHRGPKGSQVSLNFQAAKGELENLLPQFEFLSEYPLRYVEDTKLDTLRNQNVIIFRDLMGDHPLAPLLSIISSNSRIEKGSLYLNDKREKWFLLRPFLTRHECPTCGVSAHFFLEKYDSKRNIATLKSLEHGHPFPDPKNVDLYKEVGLLEVSSNTGAGPNKNA
jgi:hypothetical protein